MIVGGDDHTKEETTRVEVIDLEGLTTCDTLPDFPMPKYGATGSLIHNSPLICPLMVGMVIELDFNAPSCGRISTLAYPGD